MSFNPVHLTKRFFLALFARKMNDAELAWVNSYLLDPEFELWKRFNKADQRHTYQVAKRAQRFLGEKATRPVMAAALLHDIGKIEVDAGIILRVVASLAYVTAMPSQIEAWSHEEGWLGRAGRYLRSHELGVEHLQAAGSDPLTIAWAKEHELIPARWTIPRDIAEGLHRADNI